MFDEALFDAVFLPGDRKEIDVRTDIPDVRVKHDTNNHIICVMVKGLMTMVLPVTGGSEQDFMIQLNSKILMDAVKVVNKILVLPPHLMSAIDLLSYDSLPYRFELRDNKTLAFSVLHRGLRQMFRLYDLEENSAPFTITIDTRGKKDYLNVVMYDCSLISPLVRKVLDVAEAPVKEPVPFNGSNMYDDLMAIL